MNVKIIETGEVKTLSIIDRKSGTDWVSDLIGNAGMLAYPGSAKETVENGYFVWDFDDEVYVTSQDTYDWWAEYIADSETTEDEAQELADELNISYDDVMERIGQYTDDDYEAHRMRAIEAMAELRQEHAATE